MKNMTMNVSFVSQQCLLARCSVVLLLAVSLLGALAEARVTHIQIMSRAMVADGMAFGDTGPYEKLRGTVYFEVDPDDPRNAQVFDLDKATRNKDGLVEFSADFFILKPVDLKKGNGGLFFEVNNRGNKLSLITMNDTPPGVNENNPTAAADFGNGFLLRQGYTLAWVGWEADILPGDNRLTVQFPMAMQNGKPITGLILAEFADAKGASLEPVFTRPLSNNPVFKSYESVSTDQAVAMAELRMRPSDSPRPPAPDIPEGEVIPRDQWSFARCPGGPPGTPSTMDICLHRPGGFRNDRVYQLVYKATQSPVSGLGYVTTRDFVSFLHHATEDAAGNPNPVPGLTMVLCHGTSGSGIYMRDFLYQGFNEAEDGQKVCDGVHIHVGGVHKLFLNYRFAQPAVEGPFQHAARFAPDTNFPRTYAVRKDPLTGEMDGILKRPATDPKVIHTDTPWEYWQLRSSLVDTDEDGTIDLDQPGDVRRYLFSSMGHFRRKGVAPTYGLGNRQFQQLANPTHYGVLARALLVALDQWVRDGTEPPDSRVARIDDRTLIRPDHYCSQFPSIPDITCNGLYNASGERDFGPRVAHNRGVIDHLIPLVQSVHRVLVPAVDEIGNDVAGSRHPFVEAPIATLTGWNLRTSEFTDGDLAGGPGTNPGAMICLPRTREEALAAGDPRPSLEDLYGDHRGYVRAVAKAALDLWSERLMLLEDVFQTIREADAADEREACWQYVR